MVYIPGDEIWIVVVGFIIAFVLSIGIGANDVANTFGTSVGAKVLTLRQACIMASIVETLGAVLLGSKVTETVRNGIIDTEPYENNTELLMVGNVAALTGSCAWLFIATAFKMPVSGTHSIVGATVGFALVAHGASGVDWKQLGFIVLSWFISPLLSGAVSVALFMICKYFILIKEDPLEPGLRFLPIFYSATIVVNIFSIFYEGPSNLGFDRIPLWGILLLSFGSGILTALAIRCVIVPFQRRRIRKECRELKELERIQAEEEQRRKAMLEEMISNHSDNDELYSEKIGLDKLDLASQKPKTPLYGMPIHENAAFEMDKEDLDKKANHYVRSQVLSVRADEVRQRSSSLFTKPTSPPLSTEGASRRMRSQSESFGLAAISEVPRNRAYSENINDHHDKRFLPVANSMALNIEKRQAKSTEEKLEAEGLDTEQIAEQTRLAIEDKPEQHRLFAYLQILTAVFGGFAHGGNDVSNSIGPLVSIWLIATTQSLASESSAPIWILFYGGVGISVGLWIWGRRVIETMGEDLAKITPSTGFCIELGAASTVLVASNLGLPVSTTHCKVGSVVFVGWARARKNVNWKLFSTIVLAWILTLPVAGGISAGVMAGLMQLV